MSRQHDTCLEISSTPAPTESEPNKVEIELACGRDQWFFIPKTVDHDKVTCSKCSEIISAQKLEELGSVLRLGARVEAAGYDGFRSQYPIFVGNETEPIGRVRYPTGWGGRWQLAVAEVNGTTLGYDSIDNPARKWGSEPLKFASKSAALIWVHGNRHRFHTEAEAVKAEDEFQETRRRNRVKREAKETADRARLSDTIQGLNSIQQVLALTNYQSSAVADALERLKAHAEGE